MKNILIVEGNLHEENLSFKKAGIKDKIPYME